MSIFKDKVLLITGGTGSFGNAVLRRFLDSDIKEIRIFSRDEKKQDDMRHRLQNPKVKFYIGNVRDKASVDVAMRGVDYVFAAAALKQVPSCEFFPMEATMTNVIGTNNVLLSAIEHGVKKVTIMDGRVPHAVLLETLTDEGAGTMVVRKKKSRRELL
jgi:UDP-glucose 4-epimerase